MQNLDQQIGNIFPPPGVLKEESEKAEPIILHNTGSENKKAEELQDSVTEHFNLLLTLEQYNKFKIIIQRLENVGKDVRDAATKEIINRIIPRGDISL